MSSSKKAEVFYENSDYFMSIDVGKWLSKRGKVFADITNAILVVKNNATDADVDALMTNTIGSGLLVASDKYLVSTSSTDFGVGKLQAGKTYRMYFGIKFSGDTNYREVPLEVPKLSILQDGIRA